MVAPHNAARDALTTPRAAAIAGVVFSLLMITSLGIIRLSGSASQTTPGTWLPNVGWHDRIQLALNLIPFAGVAFLWFVGVLRNQLGQREDRFFATVFLGSGLMFVALLFSACAVAGSVVLVLGEPTPGGPRSEVYDFGIRLSRTLLNVFGMKMAAVFLFSTSAIALRTSFLPRWVALTGFGCGLTLALLSATWPWIELLFPLWVLLVSIRILVHNFFGHILRPSLEGPSPFPAEHPR